MISCFLCSSWHSTWQLSAPCPLSSPPLLLVLQTDNPLIHQLLLLAPETGRAPFHVVISPPGVFTETSPCQTHTHRHAIAPRAAFLLSWQMPGRCLWSHVLLVASSLWSELSRGWGRFTSYCCLLPLPKLYVLHFKMAVHNPRAKQIYMQNVSHAKKLKEIAVNYPQAAYALMGHCAWTTVFGFPDSER